MKHTRRNCSNQFPQGLLSKYQQCCASIQNVSILFKIPIRCTNRKYKKSKLCKYIVHLIACHNSTAKPSNDKYCELILNKLNIDPMDFIYLENIAGKISKKRKEHNKHITGTLRNSNRFDSIINKYDGTKYIHRKTDLLDGCV